MNLSLIPHYLWQQYGWVLITAAVLATLAMVILLYIKRRFPQLWFRPSQKRRVKAARRVLSKIQGMSNHAHRFLYLRKIDPFVFEELILESFERRQFRVRRNERYTGDGGIDGQFWSRQGERYLIQAKRYRSHINAQHVRDFAALVERNKCKGVFVHTGRTGAMAKALASRNPNISIISGARLMRLLGPIEVQPKTSSRAPAMRMG